MPPKGKINVRSFVHDLRSRMSAAGLMRKYRLSSEQIEAALRALERRVANPAHLYVRSGRESDAKDCRTRSQLRHTVHILIRVQDADNPRMKGRAVDVSRKGLRIVGMENRVHQGRRLVVFPPPAFKIDPISFDARCCRLSAPYENGPSGAGFAITVITKENRRRWSALVGRIIELNWVNPPTEDLKDYGLDAHKQSGHEARWTCPACRMPQNRPHEECPQCGVIVAKYATVQRSDTSSAESLRRKASYR